MCHSCYEAAGSPTIDNAAVREAVALIRQIYEYNAVGANLHIVTDDYNLEDTDLEASLVGIKENLGNSTPEQLKIETACLRALWALSPDERMSAVGLYWGDWKAAADAPGAHGRVW